MLMLLVMNVSVEFLAQVGTKNFGSGSNYRLYNGPLTVSVVGFDVNLT